ncbi:MAG: T9SS C-terminal target domain-containing protein, partial [Bacteroidetes bacterium]
NGNPQIQTKWAFNKNWLKISRDGYLFKGYTSTNGVIWKLEFQSFVFMNECLFVGPAMHSNVDYTTTTAVLSNVNFGGGAGMLQSAVNVEEGDIQENIDRTGNATESLPQFAQESDVEEVTLRPNPVENWLEIDLPQGFGEQVQLSIIDMNGKVVYTENVENEVSILALDVAALNLSKGTYILNLRSENQNVTKRFVKAQ